MTHTFRFRSTRAGFARFRQFLWAFLLGCLLSLVAAAPSWGNPSGPIADGRAGLATIDWDDLRPPGAAEFENPYEDLSRSQLIDFSELVRRRSDIELTDDPAKRAEDRAEADRLRRRLAAQGLDVDALLAEVERVRDFQHERATGTNPEFDGERVRLGGYLLPLDRTARGQIDRFLLVPFVGACVHVPPPPPNQVIYVEPDAPVKDIGLFARVWIEGVVRSAPSSHSVFRVDGYQEVEVSYELDMTAIEPASSVERSGDNILTMPSALEESDASWWDKLQLRISMVFANTMSGIQTDRSGRALLVGIAVCFGYGVLHTLGPGHGKAVIISYFVGSGGSLRRGLTMGVRVAIFHVFSAIAIVLIADLLLRHALNLSPENYPIVRLFSYGAIAAIGGWMLWQALQPPIVASPADPADRPDTKAAESLLYPSLSDRVRSSDPGGSQQSAAVADRVRPARPSAWQHATACRCFTCDDDATSGGWLSVAIGAVPCSGALAVLLYGLANNMVWTSILLVVAISVGMALTLAAIGVAAIWGRNLAERRLNENAPSAARFAAIANGIRIAGAGTVCAIGVILFGVTFATSFAT